MIRRKKIAYRDVAELVKSLASDPITGFGLSAYLMPELEEKQKQEERKANNAQTFVAMLDKIGGPETDPDKAAFLEAVRKQAKEQQN